MEYVIGFWLVGVVMTSLFVLYRMWVSGMWSDSVAEKVGAFFMWILCSVFWFISMPMFWVKVRKLIK